MPKPLPKIDVRIPFRPGAQLGAEYNHIMNETKCDWVLFLDHDIFLCNPHWYLLCQKAVQQYGKQTGMFSCWTNNLGRTMQLHPKAPDGKNLDEHIDFARAVFDQHQFSCTQIDKCSGMLLLINREAWYNAGGFPGVGIFKEDWDFSRRLIFANYKLMRIDGLYVFHLRDRTRGSWIEGIDTTKEIRDARTDLKKGKR